jgi:tetratricopeptide (TPR) repeat protein
MYSEMLGNKYFLARNYENAAMNFQHTLQIDPINKSVKKKLIICYTQIGNIQKAFENFYQLVKEDITTSETDMLLMIVLVLNSLINTEISCPTKMNLMIQLMLAMLWLIVMR